MSKEQNIDLKAFASVVFGDVIIKTRNNFPDGRYHPKVYLDTEFYHNYGIDPAPYTKEETRLIWPTVDGIGTKPELAERLYMLYNKPEYFKTLAFDVCAMIDGDEARFGRFLLGICQDINMNRATPEVIHFLALGTKEACDKGGFALLNGETAELGYRVSGYGTTRVNWSAFGISLINPDKLILGNDLAPDQHIVAFREQSVRSNGFSKAREILEKIWLNKNGYPSLEDYVLDKIYCSKNIDKKNAIEFLSGIFGHDVVEQALVPWHKDFPEITKEFLKPSTLYGKIIHEAQGWIDGKEKINITGAAHITGGGVPEKLKRLLKPKMLGAHLEHYEGIFPDPLGIKHLFKLADTLPEERKEKIINDRAACETWGRGIGFLVVVKTIYDANLLHLIAQENGVTSATIGRILDEPKIEWRGHTWTYD